VSCSHEINYANAALMLSIIHALYIAFHPDNNDNKDGGGQERREEEIEEEHPSASAYRFANYLY